MRRSRKAGRKSERRGPKASARPEKESRQLSRAEWLAFFLIFGLAVGFRVAYTLASRHSPFFGHLDLDSRFYDLWAKQIAAGDWIGDRVFFMGPLYPYFLAIVYKISGPNLVVVKIIQGLLGGLTAGLTFLLAREVFGIVVGLIAGFLAALYVPFIFYDNSILFPVLATLLNTAMLYFLYRGIIRGARNSFLLAGLLAGLSAAGNASVLAFGPPAVAFILLSGKAAFKARLPRVLLFVAGAAIIVTPITIRNAVIGHDFVPLTSNAGLNFFIGNNQRSTGAYVKPVELNVYDDPEGKAIAEAALGRELKPSEVSGYWRQRAVVYIKSNPGAFASNLLRKAFYFWSVYEVPQIEHLPFEKRYSWLLRIPSPSFGIICPLGILGVVLALRRRKEPWLLLLFMLAYSVTIIIFFVVARYRLPMVPALMVFASYAVCWWIRAGTRKRYKDLALSGVAFLALYALVHTNFYRIDPMSGFAQSHYRLGIIHEQQENFEDAYENYSKAIELDPKLAPAYVNLGILLSRLERYDEARSQLERAVELDPDYPKAHYNLGLVYAEQAQNDSALKMMDKALELRPDYHLAALAKAGIYYELARFDEAESLLMSLSAVPTLAQQCKQQIDALLAVLPERRSWTEARQSKNQRLSDAYLLRGDNLFALGLVDRALDAYLEATDVDSTAAVALYQAGTIYLNRGELDKADKLFDRALSAVPGYRGIHYAKGVIALRRGRIAEACREFEEELRVDPGSSASHINLAMCYEEHIKDLRRAAYHISKYIELTGGTQQLRDHLKELEERIDDEAG